MPTRTTKGVVVLRVACGEGEPHHGQVTDQLNRTGSRGVLVTTK